MPVSDRERAAHVFRRLSMGVQPDLAASVPAKDAVGLALDLSAAASAPPALERSNEAKPNVRAEVTRLGSAYQWWFGRMASRERMIEERLTWFWTDHFAVSLQKVRSADLVWQMHATIRRHAAGSFADLLYAVAKDGAMLVYLDGIQNAARQHNENFAREVMELHTMGRDQYTQDDVVALARSCTGWIVRLPRLPATERGAPAGTQEFGSYLVPRRHDRGTKTLLGRTGDFDLDQALDVVLAQPATARFVASKLYTALVGTPPDGATAQRLAATFGHDWSIMGLVHEIVQTPQFLADAAVRTVVRNPVEKLVGLVQATGAEGVNIGPAFQTLRALAFIPFFAPNPAGYPKGQALLGPQQLVKTFDLTAAVRGMVRGDDVLARFGVFDATPETRTAVASATDARERTALALASPEFAVR